MTPLESALSLAARGFWVFPIIPKGVGYKDKNGNLCVSDGKHPAVSFTNWATRDPKKIERRWRSRNYGVGIFTSRFGDDGALVVVDVDTKHDKRGDESLLKLELDGFDLPITLEHLTPSGGRHLIMTAPKPMKQGTDVLGSGLDIRSKGGYILGPGSTIDGKPYVQIGERQTVADAPQWLLDRLGQAREVKPTDRVPLPGVDPARARERAIEHLKTAPPAVQGEAGERATFLLAARLKDFGVGENEAVFLLDELWNERCSPPWTLDELAAKVGNAYRYGQEAQGSAAPEAAFHESAVLDEEEEDPGVHPLDAVSQDHALIKRGAFILHETTDEKGHYTTQHLSIDAFHAWYANQSITIGDKKKPISKWWMESPRRRQYEGVVFMPQQNPGPRFFNLWRGFAVEPVATAKHPALDMFLDHALKNVCRNDKQLCHWLLGYFAHLVQRPNEKPLVALVFKGRKGTGKNALVDRVGALLGSHYLLADDPRYLLSNFNSHLETNLFFVLDEATWAGDKKAEGRLKGLITGNRHNIERKGMEPYQVDNLCRVAILGNEEWMVPATHDERRFAVFSLGEGRIQDRAFFEAMRVGMEQGGYAHLLRFLMDFDLSTVDVNDAPKTGALLDQKIQSLEPVEQWWLECLTTGAIAGGDFGGEWPEKVSNARLLEALGRWLKSRQIRSRVPSDVAFGKRMAHLAPSYEIKNTAVSKHAQKRLRHHPGLEALRADWNTWLGQEMSWE